MRTSMRGWAPGLVVLGLALGGCGDEDEGGAARTDGEPAPMSAPGPAVEGTLTVFAAASLTDAFEELGAAFEQAQPNVTVRFNFAGSSSLREQILGGAPADVFASANAANMEQVIDGGEATDSEVFAANELQIAVPPGNPAGITGLEDFGDGGLLLGLCAEEVPCGQLALEALGMAGVAPDIDTTATDVRALLTQIETGDLDAGIVYRTDVLAAGDTIAGVDIPAAANVVAEYPLAALTRTDNPDAGAAFVAFVLGDEGQAILASYGFDGA